MARVTIILISLLAGTAIILAACSGGTPAKDPSAAYTDIWLTVEAAQTQTMLAAPPTPTSTNTPAFTPTTQATNTPLVSSTPQTNNTPQAGTPSSTPGTIPAVIPTLPLTQGEIVDNASYVQDVTIPDGYEAARGEVFDKIWEIKNDGPSTWDGDYYLMYGWGAQGTDWNLFFGSAVYKTVEPGETIEMKAKLTAPNAPGEYVGVFRMRNDKGYYFGPTLTVDIVVK